MALVITPEIILYLGILIQNIVGKAMKNLEGKTAAEIKAIRIAEQDESNRLMAEMHSTD